MDKDTFVNSYYHETKVVTWRALRKGQDVEGVVIGTSTHSFTGKVKDVNVANVTIEIFDSRIETFNSEETQFIVPMPEKEFKQKYFEKAKEIVKAMNTELPEYEAGEHEWENSWVDGDPYLLAKNCMKFGYKLLGYFKLAEPRRYFFFPALSDSEIGFVCETKDGKRFWCHAFNEYLENLPVFYGEFYNEDGTLKYNL